MANAFNGNALPFRPSPFWTLPLDHWDNMMHTGVRSHLVTAWYAAPLLSRGHGLLVLTGYRHDGDGVLGDHVFYDLAMTSVSRLAHAFAQDLRPTGVTALALSPGLTRTEAILRATDGDLPPGAHPVELPGRAVLALFRDPDVAADAGRTLTVDEVAARYGLTDAAVEVAP